MSFYRETCQGCIESCIENPNYKSQNGYQRKVCFVCNDVLCYVCFFSYRMGYSMTQAMKDILAKLVTNCKSQDFQKIETILNDPKRNTCDFCVLLTIQNSYFGV
jgi:hypothetical protein